MKRGVVRGVAVCLLVVTSWGAHAVAAAIYVNDVQLSLTRPILLEGGSVLVPMVEFGRAVGIDTTAETDRLVLRWAGSRRSVAIDRYAMRDGVPYAGLEWVVGLVGGEIHRVGEAWFVETASTALVDFEATSERVILRFDAFAPIVVDASDDGRLLHLTVYNSTSEVGPQLIVLGDEGIESVRVPSASAGRVEVRVEIGEGTVVRTQTVESPGFYSFTLETALQPAEASIVRIAEGIDLHEEMLVLSDVPVRAEWLYVDAWRDRYRLMPTFPTTGFGTLASIEELAASANAVAAVSLGCGRDPLPVDLLVIAGTPYVAEEDAAGGLALDLFGWWTYCTGPTTLYGRHGGQRIAIDDLNRPLQYGEVIAYSPGYVGPIAYGVPGSFTVIKVRSDRVVSVSEGPFVTADSSATLLVASGEAKGRLSLVRLGDALSLECGIGASATCYDHAFTAGPVLVDSGTFAEVPTLDGPSVSPGWSVLATDWHGGLILLSFVRESSGEAEAVGDLLALLRSMPVPIRDAIVLGRCGGSTLVLRDGASLFRLGSGEPYALALCLAPLAP
jgi:hypothetical protein